MMTRAQRRPFLSVLALTALVIAAPRVAGQAPGLSLDTATIADLQAAFASDVLTSERLVEAYLARIDAYDQQGPRINAVIVRNPKALAEARALDAERKAGKLRGPFHGVPVVLKDNFDTFDLPTTAGSQLLEGHIPAKDAFMVRKLREAGAVLVAKVNLHEFAGSGGSVSGAPDPAIVKAGTVPNGFSSAGGQTLNPHDLTRGPAGSSSGTGAAIAAAFAQVGLGTDTGGSIRNPSLANGIVGLKPTHGLLSRAGIVPLALTFDTGGPMARSVYDVALTLGVMTGVDPEDEATKKSEGRFERDYTTHLKRGALKGAPDHVIRARPGIYNLIVAAEFKAQIADYLKTTRPGFPKTLDEIVARTNDPKSGYRSPEKAVALKYTASVALALDDPVYLATKNEALAATKASIMALFAKHALDAIVYPTLPRPATLIRPETPPPADSPTSIANQTGFPDLIVPAGMTKDGLPVTISFFGTAFSEAKLLGYGYDFEQATKARVLPKHTPALASDVLVRVVSR
jgi:amidase